MSCSASFAPEIAHAGEAFIGGPGSFEAILRGAAPFAPAFAFGSQQEGTTHLAGLCFAYVNAPFSLGVTTTDGAGTATLAFSVPDDPSLAGLDVTIQYVFVEPGGPLAGAYGLSNALEVVLGP